MGQSLHLIKVVAQKAEHAHEVFLSMLPNYFYACANQVHDYAFICFYY
jgi:hypothetical protein